MTIQHGKPALLLAYYSNLKNEPRPHKEIIGLRDTFEITELALAPSGLSPHFESVEDLPPASIMRKFLWATSLLRGDMHPYLQRFTVPNLALLQKKKFDFVIAHDMAACPMAFTLAKNAPVLLDLHEYLPKVYEESLVWRVFFQRAMHNTCGIYLKKAAGAVVPSEGVANEYEKEFGVRPAVNYNAPFFVELTPSPVENTIHLVHHGSAAKVRCTAELIELMDKVEPRFHLHLYMIGSDQYFEHVKHLAKQRKNITWHSPVAMTELPDILNQYDVGIAILPNINRNHDLTIGNKIFEYIQARLALVSWPTEGINSIIEPYGVGKITRDSSVYSMIETINSLTPENIKYFKNNSNKAAHILTGEKSVGIIQEVVRNIVPHYFKN